MKTTRRFRSAAALVLVAAFTLLALTACDETDVVAKVAVSSFGAVVDKLGPQVSYDAEEQAWQIRSPAGDQLLIARDFARPDADLEAPDFEIDVDAAPFLAAGLDPAKLPMGEGYGYRVEDGRFMIHFEWGSQALKPATDGSAAPTEATAPAAGVVATFKQVIASYRERIGYHEKLDHYGFALGGGNMVEWAKDLATNDKDLVFVLDPAALIQAGLDPAKVEGWAFAQVEVKDDAGKPKLVDKLLRPFDLP